MQIELPILHLAFNDFALLALLLAILYFIAVVERWFSKDGQAASGIPLVNRQFAATWAFVGILATLVVGVFTGVPTHSDTPKLIVPLVCIAYWAYYHWRVSALIDFRLIQDQLGEIYQTAILEALRTSPKQDLTPEEVFERVVKHVDSGKLLAGGGQLVKRVAPVPLHTIVETLMFTPVKVKEVLDGLVAEGKVNMAQGRYSVAGIALPDAQGFAT